jgi:hypothetical protein
LVIAISLEVFITLVGIPFAATGKLKSMNTVKTYLLDMVLINILTSPIFAFGILAIYFMIRVNQIT